MADCVLGICDGTGFVVDAATNSAAPCRCRAQIVSRRKARSLSAVIPKYYKDVSFDRNPVAQMPDSVVRPVRAFVRNLDENLEAGRGLWLFGDVGTGKTTLAMIVAKAALEAGHSVAIYSMPRLLNEIRRTYDENSDSSYIQLLDRLAAVDLLHIDDVGAEKSSAWVLEQLYAIVNARYEGQRSINITTNLSHEALAEQVTPRTVSRLGQMSEAIPLLGQDKRPVLEHSA
jgi:DNA replication protein DnaC